MDTLALLGSAFGLSFVAGVRLYATVLVVGLGLRLGWLHLTPALAGLQVLADPWILATAAALFALEFLADKIAWFDSLWDAVHTIIRPLGAAALAALAVVDVEPQWVVIAGLFGGAIGLSGHSAKATVRLAVNQSPEPFSNIAVSLLEDLAIPGLVWLALAFPVVMLVFVLLCLVATALIVPRLWRFARRSWQTLTAWRPRRSPS